MPKTSIDRQEFNNRKPFLAASAFALALTLLAVGWSKHRNLELKRTKVAELTEKVNQLTPRQNQVQRLLTQTSALQAQASQMAGLVEDRFYAVEVLNELRQVSLNAEQTAKQALNTDVGVWFETVSVGGPPPVEGGDSNFSGSAPSSEPPPEGGRRRRRGGGDAEAVTSTNSLLNTTCRAVDRSKVSPTAKDTIAYALLQQATNSPLFSPAGTTLGAIKDDPATQTFTFGLTIKLNRPLRQ